MYGIIRLCTIKRSCLSCADSNWWRRWASHTDWKVALYDEGRRIEVFWFRGVNISGIDPSRGRRGTKEERMRWRVCCIIAGDVCWAILLRRKHSPITEVPSILKKIKLQVIIPVEVLRAKVLDSCFVQVGWFQKSIDKTHVGAICELGTFARGVWCLIFYQPQTQGHWYHLALISLVLPCNNTSNFPFSDPRSLIKSLRKSSYLSLSQETICAWGLFTGTLSVRDILPCFRSLANILVKDAPASVMTLEFALYR